MSRDIRQLCRVITHCQPDAGQRHSPQVREVPCFVPYANAYANAQTFTGVRPRPARAGRVGLRV
jgi:hypothetical protein